MEPGLVAVPDPRYCCAVEINCSNQALNGMHLCRRCTDEGFHAEPWAAKRLDAQDNWRKAPHPDLPQVQHHRRNFPPEGPPA